MIRFVLIFVGIALIISGSGLLVGCAVKSLVLAGAPPVLRYLTFALGIFIGSVVSVKWTSLLIHEGEGQCNCAICYVERDEENELRG